MTQEKPGGWPLGHTTERARQLAVEEAKKKEEEKIKKGLKGAIHTILSKQKK